MNTNASVRCKICMTTLHDHVDGLRLESSYGTFRSISGRSTTLSWAVASLREPINTAGFSLRFTATCNMLAGMKT